MKYLTLKWHLQRGDLCSWREWDLTDSRQGAAHRHRDFREIFWVISGRGVHWINGQRFALQGHMLVLVHQQDRHVMMPLPGEHLRFINLAFPIANWMALQKRYWAGRPDLFAWPEGQRHLHLQMGAWAQLQQDAEELRHGRTPRTGAALDRFLLNLHYLVEGAAPAVARPGEKDVPDWLAGALQRMQDPQLLREGLGALLRLCHKSREHVARVTRKQLGQSPTDLVNDRRLVLAAKKLAQTDRKILDIALECGFGHLGHFYKEFTRRYYLTPSVYRRQQQQLLRAGERELRA